MKLRSDQAMFLLTGPSASGKSTVGRLLAQRFSRGVHLEGDVFRRSIVSGRRDPDPGASTEAQRQLRLRYRLAADAADRYFDNGFSVVLEDVIAGPMLADCVGLVRARPLHVVTLFPAVEVIVARDPCRGASGYSAWSVRGLYDLFALQTPRIGVWVDNSDHIPEETVDEILHQITEAKPPDV